MNKDELKEFVLANPKLVSKNSAAHLGQTRPKVVCRLSDRKEMCLSHFNRYT